MSLSRNVIANFAGQGWSAVMGLAFLPLYIKLLGLEAYGLIGVYAIMQAWFTLLDVGMTPTISREMARFSAGARTAKSIRDLLRTLATLCSSLAALLFVVVWGGARWIAEDWLNLNKLGQSEVVHAIILMGGVSGLRLVEGLYRGAMVGLQQQILLNAIGAVSATLRWAGAVAVLAFVLPTIEAFFYWQLMVSGATMAAYQFAVYRLLPKSEQAAAFSRIELANVWRFAGGMMGITLLSLFLTQIDKILLSKLLSLDDFGRYTFAATVAGALLQLVTPISQAFFPRLTELVAREDADMLVSTYHRGAQMVSAALMPMTALMVVFGQNIITLWTGDGNFAGDIDQLLSLLAIGTMCNGLMHIPYMLQLANGWPALTMRVNAVAATLVVPALLYVTPRFGAIGAAWVWVALNASYLVVTIYFMHGQLLKSEKWNWYAFDIVIPFLAIFSVAWALSVLQPPSFGKVATIVWLSLSLTLQIITAIIVMPSLRARACILFFSKRTL